VKLVRFISYFTIESNLLVMVVAATLAIDPERDGRWWRVLRLNVAAGEGWSLTLGNCGA
jgi:hypothetical protein